MREIPEDTYYDALKVMDEITKCLSSLRDEADVLLAKSISLSARNDKSFIEKAEQARRELNNVKGDISVATFLHESLRGIMEQFFIESLNPDLPKTAAYSFIEFKNSSTFKTFMVTQETLKKNI